ncbi:hypothetical protein ABBQ32_008548 [Trebouxia sp. C0010 RCD-2024]
MSCSLRDQAACTACRVALAYAIGDVLAGRVELNTPLHSLISIREGLFWKQVGRSPYTASVFQGPPLLLQLCQLTAKHLVWQAIILSLVDWITSCVLERVVTHAVRLSKQDNAEHTYIKQSAQFLYLVNPFLILSTASGSTANLANLAVIAALYGGLSSNTALAGLGLATGCYLSAHPALLIVPTALLLLEQDRNLDKTAPPAISSHGSLPADKHKLQQPDMPLLHQRVAKPVLSRNKPHIVLQLLSYTALFTLGLLVLSDMQLRHYPEHFTTSLFKTRVQGATPLPLGTQSPVHWTRHVYGYMLMGPDSTPNIGMWWYFFAEVFPSWRCPMKALFGIATVLPPLLLTIKLHKQPLLLFACQCIVTSMLKPYPTAADAAQFMALLPLFPELLLQLPSRVFTATSLLLLAYLGPTMWYLWMDLGTGNANFFYAITLLWAAWQAMLLLQMVTIATHIDTADTPVQSKHKPV